MIGLDWIELIGLEGDAWIGILGLDLALLEWYLLEMGCARYVWDLWDAYHAQDARSKRY